MDIRMPDRTAPVVSATLLLGGQLLAIVITQFHPGGVANDHPAVFAAYAGSGTWTAVHLGQFVATSILIGGLVAFCFALDGRAAPQRWAARLGAGAAVVALALYGVVMAVDGVALKQAVNAWASAPAAEKPARFAGAEAIRWIEWGARSYENLALALALLLIAVAAARTAWVLRPVPYLMGLAGLIHVVQGWVAGAHGFPPAHDVAIVAAWVVNLVWMGWLAVGARAAHRTSGKPLS